MLRRWALKRAIENGSQFARDIGIGQASVSRFKSSNGSKMSASLRETVESYRRENGIDVYAVEAELLENAGGETPGRQDTGGTSSSTGEGGDEAGADAAGDGDDQGKARYAGDGSRDVECSASPPIHLCHASVARSMSVFTQANTRASGASAGRRKHLRPLPACLRPERRIRPQVCVTASAGAPRRCAADQSMRRPWDRVRERFRGVKGQG